MGSALNPSRQGKLTALTPKGAVTAKAESQVLAKANGKRAALYVTNCGAKDVFLAFGDTAKAKEGVKLEAETGATVIEGYAGAVSVITEEGESLVTYAEV